MLKAGRETSYSAVANQKTDTRFMLYKNNAKTLLATTTVVSWLLLLVYVLLTAESKQAGSNAPGFAYPFISNLLIVIFIVSVFLFQRLHTEMLKGVDFIGYLWNLFSKAGVAAYLSVALYLVYRVYINYIDEQYTLLLHVVYQINFGLLVLFLAKAFYIWRQLLLHHKNKFLQIAWDWFELLLGGILLLTLFNFKYTSYVFLPLLALMGFYILFLCTNLKWVAYLTFSNKSRSLVLLGAILLSCYIFIRFFYNMADNEQLTVDYTDVGFLLLAMLFVGLYTLAAFLVSLFSLPTSSVFEQKSEDLLNFQRLSLSIQQGQSEAQVYDMLVDSTIKASDASAAWFEVIRNSDPQVTHLLNITEAQVKSIRHLLQAYNIHNMDYINNNLGRNPGFRGLGLPWKSMAILPIKSTKHLSGVLYLLKDVEGGFDHETVNVLRTFTSQTTLTIENLRLISESLQNERYKEELKIATQVQESLNPKTFPTDSWFEISTHSVAAKEVGGDFYDFLQLSESRIAIIIGDVSGKGISAAFHMAQMKGIFHGLMQQDMAPSEFMKQANSALSRCLERTSFITSSLYIIDYRMKGFMFARAGHCHTLYYNSMMDDVFYFKTDGLGLGILRDDKAYAGHIREMYYDYNPGDVMVIYTDGIVEARNLQNEEYGEDRLLYMLKQTYHLEADDIKYAIINDVNDFTGPDNVYDDQTLLVIKFRPTQQNI
ncbi:GAF domain-containing SpoIIE family protein phosphatase [Pontibacter chinhatensis]|uniref:Serine phosphatase RsbU, regulator of sigma subunit n=1 Tax=Pontibacter chinhatensis TaxID=1436961 RepID=A0A1I2VKC9_9BACT|nr:GAF domain-containing SpoIIE family protein phosphatase [Pontibacter chinhatensis]SFG89738.1 Serine phosphatase RsbU, regulator of sigma subunit [Pontibacter chinhatensis]